MARRKSLRKKHAFGLYILKGTESRAARVRPRLRAREMLLLDALGDGELLTAWYAGGPWRITHTCMIKG